MYINTFQYKPEHVDCTLCTEYTRKKGCTAKSCPWLAERIEAGVGGYKEAIMETFPRDPHLEARLNTAVRRFSGSLFLSPAHYQRMEQKKAQQGYRRRRDTPAYCAAMYLLTANEDICTRTANCFCRYSIEFDYDDKLQDLLSRLLSTSQTTAYFRKGVVILYRLVVTEKPSVAMRISKVLGASARKEGHMEGGGWLVSWCVGHLAEFSTSPSAMCRLGITRSWTSGMTARIS